MSHEAKSFTAPHWEVAPEQERELLTFLKRMEQYLIDHVAINAVGFRFVGSV